jgi:hypothetical protein
MSQTQFINHWIDGRKTTTCRPISPPHQTDFNSMVNWAAREFAASRARFPERCMVAIKRWTGKAYRSPQELVCTRRLEQRWIVTIRRGHPTPLDIDVVATVMPGHGLQLDDYELEYFAYHEGFEDIGALRDWFTINYPKYDEWHGMCYKFICPSEIDF